MADMRKLIGERVIKKKRKGRVRPFEAKRLTAARVVTCQRHEQDECQWHKGDKHE